MIRCHVCGSYAVECASDKPVAGCGCARCLRASLAAAERARDEARSVIEVESKERWKMMRERNEAVAALREIEDAAWKGNSAAAHPLFREKISSICRAVLEGGGK